MTVWPTSTVYIFYKTTKQDKSMTLRPYHRLQLQKKTTNAGNKGFKSLRSKKQEQNGYVLIFNRKMMTKIPCRFIGEPKEQFELNVFLLVNQQ